MCPPHLKLLLHYLENSEKCDFSTLSSVVVKTFFRSRDRDLGLQVSRPRPRSGSSGLETEIWTKWTRVLSSLETMVSKSHHWLHRFQLVTEHSLKGAANYGNRVTGVGTKHAVLRSRPRPGSSGLETETLAIRSRDRDRDRYLDKMNSSALESQDHGLEITTLTLSKSNFKQTANYSIISIVFIILWQWTMVLYWPTL